MSPLFQQLSDQLYIDFWALQVLGAELLILVFLAICVLLKKLL